MLIEKHQENLSSTDFNANSKLLKMYSSKSDKLFSKNRLKTNRSAAINPDQKAPKPSIMETIRALNARTNPKNPQPKNVRQESPTICEPRKLAASAAVLPRKLYRPKPQPAVETDMDVTLPS